ncbi:exonuclease V [Schizophyllum commune]
MAILIERLAKLVFSEYQYQVTETPVFGVMNGMVVMGSIDIIRKRRDEGSSGAIQSSEPPEEKSQNASEGHSVKAESHCRKEVLILELVDIKTRDARNAIHDDNTAHSPNHIQLMCYHRLLSALLDPSFDFEQLWKLLDLDPHQPFPTRALDENGRLKVIRQQPSTGSRTCLQDLVERFCTSRVRKDFDVKVSPDLQLEYYTKDQRDPFYTAVFPMDDGMLDRHLEKFMKWWHGDREPEGVIEELRDRRCG